MDIGIQFRPAWNGLSAFESRLIDKGTISSFVASGVEKITCFIHASSAVDASCCQVNILVRQILRVGSPCSVGQDTISQVCEILIHSVQKDYAINKMWKLLDRLVSKHVEF